MKMEKPVLSLHNGGGKNRNLLDRQSSCNDLNYGTEDSSRSQGGDEGYSRERSGATGDQHSQSQQTQ